MTKKDDKKDDKKDESKHSNLQFVLATYPDDLEILEFTFKIIGKVLYYANAEKAIKEKLITSSIDDLLSALTRHPKVLKLQETIFEILGLFSLRDISHAKIAESMKEFVAVMKAHHSSVLIERCAGFLCNLVVSKKTDYKPAINSSGAIELFEETLAANPNPGDVNYLHNVKACLSTLKKLNAKKT